MLNFVEQTGSVAVIFVWSFLKNVGSALYMNPIHYSMWFQGSGFSRCAWWMNHRHYLERTTSWWWMMGERLLDTIGCIRHDIFCHGILFNPNHNPAYRIVMFPAGSNTLMKHCPLLLWFETLFGFSIFHFDGACSNKKTAQVQYLQCLRPFYFLSKRKMEWVTSIILYL